MGVLADFSRTLVVVISSVSPAIYLSLEELFADLSVPTELHPGLWILRSAPEPERMSQLLTAILPQTVRFTVLDVVEPVLYLEGLVGGWGMTAIAA